MNVVKNVIFAPGLFFFLPFSLPQHHRARPTPPLLPQSPLLCLALAGLLATTVSPCGMFCLLAPLTATASCSPLVSPVVHEPRLPPLPDAARHVQCGVSCRPPILPPLLTCLAHTIATHDKEKKGRRKEKEEKGERGRRKG